MVNFEKSANRHIEYILTAKSNEISFFAYRADTANATDPKTAAINEEINSELRGYFLRKGFSNVLTQLNPDIVTPIYKGANGTKVQPESIEEALKLIYDGKITVTGFTFNPKVPESQKEEAFANMLDVFVDTSRNPDLTLERNSFSVGITNDLSNVQTSWKGNQEVTNDEILQRLDLEKEGIKVRQDYRQMILNERRNLKKNTM